MKSLALRIRGASEARATRSTLRLDAYSGTVKADVDYDEGSGYFSSLVEAIKKVRKVGHEAESKFASLDLIFVIGSLRLALADM